MLNFILGPVRKAKPRGASRGGHHDWYGILVPPKKRSKLLGIAIAVVHHLKGVVPIASSTPYGLWGAR